MAKYVYPADKYPNGTKLSAVAWSYTGAVDFQVAEIGATGRKYWDVVTGVTADYATADLTPSTGVDILLIKDFAISEVPDPRLGFNFYLNVAAFADQVGVNYERTAADANSGIFIYPSLGGRYSSVTNNAVTTASNTTANAMRINYDVASRVLKVRVWGAAVGGLEAAEPVIWHYQGTYDRAFTLAPNVNPMLLQTTPNVYENSMTAICIGTDGDVAPYPDPAQTVTTPTSLTVTNITDTTADADWV